MQKTYISKSREQTIKLAKNFSQQLKPGSCIGLIGELGSGKTVFVKGLAKGLGIKENVTSPTFTLLQIYTGKIPLYHFDLYRLNSINELQDIGYEEYLHNNTIAVIEWAEKFIDLFPKNGYLIYFKYINKSQREIKITQSE